MNFMEQSQGIAFSLILGRADLRGLLPLYLFKKYYLTISKRIRLNAIP
jgi:hypothetical protein